MIINILLKIQKKAKSGTEPEKTEKEKQRWLTPMSPGPQNGDNRRSKAPDIYVWDTVW